MDPSFASLADLSKALSEGSLTSSTITRHFLERIARHDKALGAFVHVDAERAMSMAEGLDKLRASGVVYGPLHGLPIAVKDLVDWQDETCTVGSAAWKDRRSTSDATVMRKLLAAGMIPIGRAAMVEFAFGGWGTNPICGTPRNPWDMQTHRIPGGSSSGSGVAVAAGLAPAAIGSDTGGSVRIPAALNGIVGLKPTYGRISLKGCFPLSSTLDSIGPMTRTVADAALLLDALCGPDASDPATRLAPALKPGAWQGLRTQGMRVAVMREEDFPIPLDAESQAAYDQAKEALISLGVTLVPADLPFAFNELTESNGRIIAAEAYAVHRDYIHDESVPIGPYVRQRVLAGANVSANDYIETLAGHRRMKAVYADFMKPFDALLTPTVPFPAIPVSEVDETAVPMAAYGRPANYVGACGLALPAGFTETGLPLSVQLMGAAFAEEPLLALGAALEQRISTTDRLPDLTAG
ncbi:MULTISPECIES: amidase [Alphaproteobacteria]|uniref:amidase n=1 Tax=Alphaproteobacteria TaxID=28211 RepID=UPI0019D3A7FA|nr:MULTISPECIES: amidase [Alphaproteobacteria]MBN7756916.1 amidase [Nitratireductor aquimarinus]MBY5999467.1 amidase [Tritonibacter mobilis]MBY6021493.1 amidase [Nitratireductor sp. DP7N14-4]